VLRNVQARDRVLGTVGERQRGDAAGDACEARQLGHERTDVNEDDVRHSREEADEVDA
jgi:hypothetical protein